MAYNQIEVTKETGKILAVSTHKGIYTDINRLSFGVKPAGAIFEGILEKVLLGTKGVVSFSDDIIITGKNDEEHIQNLSEVLSRLQEEGFKVDLRKAEFFKTLVQYLGHIIDNEGLHKYPEKVAAIVDIKRPTNATELKAFRMIIFYGKFVPLLSDMFKPLYDLQKQIKFKWNREQEEAFINIKKEITDGFYKHNRAIERMFRKIWITKSFDFR